MIKITFKNSKQVIKDDWPILLTYVLVGLSALFYKYYLNP